MSEVHPESVIRRLKRLLGKKPLPPPREFRHPDLGLLTFDSGLWSGKIHRHGREIPFVLAGTESGPNSTLVDALLSLLGGFQQTESTALQFLCSPGVPVTAKEFTFQSLNFLWPETPDRFTLEFTLQGDTYAIWRVDFEAGSPKYTGRDD